MYHIFLNGCGFKAYHPWLIQIGIHKHESENEQEAIIMFNKQKSEKWH
jgi:hypothetical protein